MTQREIRLAEAVSTVNLYSMRGTSDTCNVTHHPTHHFARCLLFLSPETATENIKPLPCNDSPGLDGVAIGTLCVTIHRSEQSRLRVSYELLDYFALA